VLAYVANTMPLSPHVPLYGVLIASRMHSYEELSTCLTKTMPLSPPTILDTFLQPELTTYLEAMSML